MKKLLHLATVALMLLGAAISTPAKPVDLTSFRGVYRGKVVVTISDRTYPGDARIVVRTGKRGRSAVMSITGEFRANGRTFPISNRLDFLRSRNFTEQSITNGFAGASIGAAGRYTAHRRRLDFRAPFAVNKVSGTAAGTAAVRRGRHRKQVLALATSITLHGQPQDYVFDFRVSKYVEP